MMIIAMLVGVAAFLFWMVQLWTALTMTDEEFPGRNDKLVWVMVVFFGSVIGALLFVCWRAGRAFQQESEARLARKMTEALYDSKTNP